MDNIRNKNSHLFRKSGEGSIKLTNKVVEDLLHLRLRSRRNDELHGSDLVDEVIQGSLDLRISDSVITLVVLDSLHTLVIVVSNDMKHANLVIRTVANSTYRLVEGAGVIVFRISVLLQEVFFDDLCNLQNDLLVLTEGLLANQLDDFLKVVFLLQDGTDASSHGDKIGIDAVEEGL